MRKPLCVLLAMVLVLEKTACGAPVSTETTSPSGSAEASAVVTFAVAVLEARARFKILGDVAVRE